MQAPRFWYRPPGLAARLLSPLGLIYAGATARRLARGVRFDPGVPVICVGNLTAGGTGKTPTVIALVERLRDRGVTAHVLTRGHGGTAEGPLRVDERRHGAAETGDEALLLSAFAPTWVAKDRAEGARAAVAAGAGALILDDGFQDPALAVSLGIVVADAERGFGNEFCIPAGPLREPVATGLRRADLLLTVGAVEAQDRFTAWTDPTPPRIRAALEPLQTGMDWRDTPYFAFAGIGAPEKFFATLRGLGARLVHSEALSDHQPLTQALLTRLANDARAHGAQLVTTEKDAVRLPPAWRQQVVTLPVRLVFTEAAALDAALDRLFPA
ncbi:tetraacyldisaccharide 4'-kinase [Oceanicola sp. 22II-s10i]|uniref:tetraacyldisaccharide 4'-kinase n=1 Tax=Oceanicola sp. 22II-s10i TaxID=1317116 RepID=UPI001595A807|nr:tetraacyldisaccharide 4'-kinase [Oceanicola sp. 22II-s10i]